MVSILRNNLIYYCPYTGKWPVNTILCFPKCNDINISNLLMQCVKSNSSLVRPVSFTAGLYWQPCNIMFLFTGKTVPVWWVWEELRPQERPTGAHTGSAHWYSLQMWRLPKVEVFNSERNLNRHKAANHTDITYTCEICKNTYYTNPP